mmetsp:Transcript_20519/g.48680  ORF Transcript_20519/g.48680 Transcript_20519/m.48680 type:complete len:121 (-) Transcript_20519:263-625(-)|eukprot:CAMPEP_0181475688 /NCGR_PEP_ID=MMETSP1110-20121109/41316_1 /TAXON_ID=174948 /ORGANISM="Symbiodinium sp., Strain CCMP421" /LENGTH=120 /DNA_ID=CAMNT_0023600939 /DNA_START=96 /DNA_END=458 /DNA_ORIENTATION=+
MGCCESSRPHVPHARHERQYSNPAMTLPVGYTPGEGKPYVPLHEAQPARKAPYQEPYHTQSQPFGQPDYEVQPYQADRPLLQSGCSHGSHGLGGGMAMAGAGLAGFAGGFIAAEIMDDIF